jgi:hypothetical protein
MQIIVVMLIASAPLTAQNFQVHYALSEDRQYFWSRFQMFKPDDFGATYTILDFTYNNEGHKSASMAYFEFWRYIKLPMIERFMATVQYYDGLANTFSFGNVWAVGLNHLTALGPFMFLTDLLYRGQHGMDANIQLQAGLFGMLLDGKIESVDVMRIYTSDGEDGKKVIFLSALELWYNMTKNIAIGGEVEITKNFFPGEDRILFKPGIGLKWNF